MHGSYRSLAAMLLIAAVFGPLAAHAADSSTKPSAATVRLLPRDAVVPVRMVTRYFADVTKEAGKSFNETAVGNATGSLSLVFIDAAGTKKITLSVDEYASAVDAAAAFQTAVRGSKAAPGFKLTAAPGLGEESFAGTSRVGAEMHYGLGAREGRVIVSATHAGDIPVTPHNSKSMISLAGAVLTAARRVLRRGAAPPR